MLHLHP
jgi:death on curing protein